MKKIKILLISLISVFSFNINVFAASGSLSVSSESVYVGDSFIVTANIDAAAAWNVHVSASGPVSGCTINQADATADAMDTNKAFSAKCTATGEGIISITLSGDATSASDGNAVNISGNRNVNVSAKPAPANDPEPNNNNQSNNDNQPTSTNNNDNKSKNNNIKDLSIEGYELVKVDDNNYTLSVPNDVSSVNIKATTEDSKAKITGLGKHDINVGENNIEIIVTAENGTQRKITIKVTRKEDYYLEDLDSALKNDKGNDINITIKSDTKISAQDLEKIKSSKSTVNFNYYNDDKKLVYSWIVDGLKIKDTNDFITTISNDSSNKKDILKLSNYADGLFIELKQTNNIPAGTKIKFFVGNKYDSNDLINIYSYSKNSDKLNLINKQLKVENGYVIFDINDASDYLLTMSNIPSSEEAIITTGTTDKSLPKITLIIVGTISLIIMLITSIVIIKSRKNKKDNTSNTIDEDKTMESNNEKLDSPIITNMSSNQINGNNINDLNNLNFPKKEEISNNQQDIIFPNIDGNTIESQNNNFF